MEIRIPKQLEDLMIDVQGRVMMVSGANRGIGAALAKAYARDGWSLSLGSRDPESLQTTVEDIDPQRVTCHAYDARDPAAARSWIEHTLDHFGRLDGLTNNAAVAHMAPLFDLAEADLDDMWQVNVIAPLRLLRLAVPHLSATGEGRVVSLISMSGKRVRGTFAPGYSITKHAALALHHAVRHATFDQGIRATAVCPGFVATDMVDGLGPAQVDKTQPEDLAETVATMVRLPNTANVPELMMVCEPEVTW